VHVGYEPKRNLIIGMNGQTILDLPFLTRSLDWMPFITTEKESKLLIEGEIAQIIPDPNPLGAAYIDDFESSRIKKSLGISYGIWAESSYPDKYDVFGNYELHPGVLALPHPVPLQYFLKSYSGKQELSFYWYNPKDEHKITKEDIYSDVPGDQRKDKVNTLNFVFRPQLNDEAFTSIDFRPEDSWGGVMRYLHPSYQDFREVRYIEFLAQTNGNVRLYFDIGDLSEDVIPNGRLDTEDRNRNNVLDIGDETEDVGLDGMKGPGGFYALGPYDHDDPRSREPYEFYSFDNRPVEPNGNPTPDSQLENYWDFIKTESNGKLDSEDLDGGGNLDTTIRAYRYYIDLKPNPTESDRYVVSTDFRQGSNFALYRIPVEDFADVLNREPDLSRIRYMKVWMNNSSDTLHSVRLNFVSLDLVGNEWNAKGTNRGKIEAKTINNQDDKGRYYSPPGVKELDDYGFEKPEQSLSMSISLSPFLNQDEYDNGRYAFLSKDLFRGENYLQYEEIKMFIHGGTRAADPYWDNDRPLYFIYRFGTDSLNYYEYRSKLVNGWSGEGVNNQMVVKLKDLSDLKTLRSDSNSKTDSLFLKNYNDTAVKRYIGIRGNPTLQSVKFFNAGVLDSAHTALETEIWINELRLAKVLKNSGTAARGKIRLEAADILTADAEIMKQDENFHRIEESRGTGVNQLNYNFNTSMNVDKMLPRALGISVPVRYTHNGTSSFTKYQGTTDILVDHNNIPDSVRSESKRNQFDFSLSRTAKSERPYLKYTIDNMRLSGNASFNDTSNPSHIYQRSKSFNYNLGYNLVLPAGWFSFSPFFWGKDIFFFNSLSGVKFAFFPNSYNFNVNTSQSGTTSLSRRNNFTENRSFLVTRNFSTSLQPLPFINSNYTMTLKSDMYREAVKKDSTEADTVITVYDRGMTDLFMLEFGELTSLESGLRNTLKINLSKYLTNDVTHNTSYSWNGNLTSRTVTSTIRNRYNASLNSKLNTKEVISSIQSGIKYILPKREKKEENKEDTENVEKQAQPEQGIPRLSRTGSSSGKKKKSLLDLLRENLSDFNFSFSQGRENSYTDIPSLNQADPAFFFGFANEPDTKDYTSMNWAGNWDFKASTRLKLTNNLGLDGISYNFARAYRQNNNDGFTGNDSETAFIWPFVTDDVHRKSGTSFYILPNYSIAINNLHDLLQAKDKISSLTLSHAKSGSISSQWYVEGTSPDMYLTGIPDLEGTDLKTRGISYNTAFSPLVGLRLNMRNGMNFTANYNYSFDLKENYSYQENIKRLQSGSEKRYSREFRVSGGYNQRGGFEVPINIWPFKGVKLDNDISYNLTLSYTSNNRHKYDIESNEYEALDKGNKSDSFTVSPNISYSISKNLNGTVSYSYNYNESQNYEAKSVVNTNHRFELRAVLSISGR
jgi:hypothetical protein